MINKVVRSLVTDLENIFHDHSIDVPARNTPDLSDFRQWGRNFMASDLSSPPAVPDKNMLNGLLYKVASIKLNTERLANTNLRAFTHNSTDHIDSEWINQRMPYLAPVVDHIHHIRVGGAHDPVNPNPKDETGRGLIRNVSLLDLELEFMVISDSQDLIYDIHMIFYQLLLFKNAMEIDFIFNDTSQETFTLPYQVLFDRDSVLIDYANFDTVKNTIQFTVVITGAFMSNYFMKENLIDLVDLQVALEPTSQFWEKE